MLGMHAKMVSYLPTGGLGTICQNMAQETDQLVDAKINTLESEGKCSPSSEKSTKRAS